MKTTHLNHPLETYTPRLIALGLLAMLLLLAVSGCKTKTAAETNPAGIYHLVSVDGQNVPCDLTHEGVTMTIKSGAFTIHTNGSCSSLMVFSVASHGDMRREVNAAYTRNGAEFTMQWERAGTTRGRLDGNQFTMNNEGMVLLYRK